MLKKEKKDSLIVHLSLSLVLATTPMAANVLVSVPVVGQSKVQSKTDVSNFPLAEKVESGTKVRIDGSMSLGMINQSLKDSFEKKFSGTEVEIAVNGTEAALKKLLDGEIDIAAIARGLTPEEKAQGLKQIALRREKIAIIVGAKNPFQGGLTIEQFAKIFRGEITDWSELGGTSGKIRFIDHPLTSNTRNSFRDYPVFKSAQFTTGANAVKVTEDKTALIIEQLGTNGISYATANQVSKLSNVRILKIQGLTADNSKYPFSQPLVYVYNQNPSPAVASFLGFSTAPVGKKAIEAARDTEASAIATSEVQNFTLKTATNAITEPESANTPPNTTPSSENTNVVNSWQTETLHTTNNSGEQQFINPLTNRNQGFLTLFSLLPVFGLGSLLNWWLKRKRQLPEQKTSKVETSSTSASITQTTLTIPQLTIPDENSTNTPINNTTITNSTSHPEQNTNPKSIISTSKIPLDCGEVVWDTEAPVAVVNNPYPGVINIPEQQLTNPESSTDDLMVSLLELLEKPAQSSAQVSNISLSELISIPTNSEGTESQNSLSQLLSVSENANGSDAKTSLLELDSDSRKNSDIKPINSLSELLGLNSEETALDLDPIANKIKKSLSDLSNELEEAFNKLANQEEIKADWTEETINDPALYINVDTENVSRSDMSGDSSIIFTPRTPQWGYVSWYISETHKQAAKNIGGTILAIRLYDATDIDLSYQIPQLVQQYECEEITSDCYVAIPITNRDYVAEIGYMTNNNHWLSIARSGKIRIFSRPGKDFWFVADTELIIHGSTEPSAKVTIGDHEIQIQSDGTFHFRVPFSDRLSNYLMTATAANGEQSITILKKFFQENS